MKACAKQILSCTLAVPSGIILVSALALGGAYYSQFALGLEPCILCLYQRIPYAAAILLALGALALRKKHKAVSVLVFLCALAFMVNAGIAFYHVGVEQKLWVSAVEGCAVPSFGEEDSGSILDKIMRAPTARCDEIPWQDPVLGISMAGYNALLCVILFVGCGLAALQIRQRPSA